MGEHTNRAEGQVKQAVGALTGNDKLRHEGQRDEAKGVWSRGGSATPRTPGRMCGVRDDRGSGGARVQMRRGRAGRDGQTVLAAPHPVV